MLLCTLFIIAGRSLAFFALAAASAAASIDSVESIPAAPKAFIAAASSPPNISASIFLPSYDKSSILFPAILMDC